MEAAAEILDFLAGGGLVVTANSRASRALRRAYAEWQRRRGAEAWVSAVIDDWASWLDSLWQQQIFAAKDAPLLLSPLQERWLWTRILHSQPESKLVVSLDPLASLAQQAYSLLADYAAQSQRLHPWSTLAEDSVSDPEAFRRWASVFDRECRQRRAMSHSQLAQMLTEAIRSGSIAAPAEVRLLGFDKLTPAQQNLVDALQEKGCRVSMQMPQAASTDSRLVLARNLRDEIATCAAWLRSLLLGTPNLRIAVIVPDAASVRGEIDRAFRRTLAPESLDVAARPAPLPFEFSLGVSLATVPVARAALLLLRWIDTPLLAGELSWLLLSAFAATTDTDMLALAQIDARLRNSGLLQQEIGLSSFLGQRGWQTNDAGQKLHECLANMYRLARGKPRREPMEWSELAQTLLAAAGWPGLAPADSIEFQARKKWTHLLESMATLGFDDSSLTYREFLSFLERQANEAIFAPESHDAPIQILGPAESSGQSFDALWFLGADDNSWPPSGRPHPMLPIPVQRSAGMPHTSAEADWSLARATTLRIAASAPISIFSYSFQNKDGALRPTPLLRELPRHLDRLTAAVFRTEFALEAEPQVHDHTERVRDSDGIPWPAQISPGGFAVLKRQSACPFQAFAAKRLAAGELQEAQWGLSALQRGELLHSVLERLWCAEAGSVSRLHSLGDLQSAMRDHRLDAMLSLHIEEVFRRNPATQAADPWGRAYLEAEKNRLHSLLTSWLAYEATRQPFEVEACEKELKDVHAGPLRLDLRVDRVDLLTGDARLLIDYKTSEVSTAKWTVPRLEEPQLPLYAMYGGLENVQGVLFAQIRAGDIKFAGHVKDAKNQLFSGLDGKSPFVRNPYEELMKADWADDILNLANEFLRGEASVSPKQYPGTCAHCAFPELCRVAETEEPHKAIDAANNENETEEEASHD